MILTTTLLSYFFLSLVIALGLCQLRREAARCIQEAVDENKVKEPVKSSHVIVGRTKVRRYVANKGRKHFAKQLTSKLSVDW